MAHLTLLHTAEVHVATFDALAPSARLGHMVRPDWLARAQPGITPDLAAEITQAIRAIDGPVLCTCTTLGSIAEAAGATRIDWPMMQTAARIGGPVLMAYCLDSTVAPSTALLRRAFGAADPQLQLLDLTVCWPLFAEGQVDGFADAIADRVLHTLTGAYVGCVVLAQASMAGAAKRLAAQTAVPVLTSPALALQYMLQQTGQTPSA